MAERERPQETEGTERVCRERERVHWGEGQGWEWDRFCRLVLWSRERTEALSPSELREGEGAAAGGVVERGGVRETLAPAYI
jgi:hypothetical protein